MAGLAATRLPLFLTLSVDAKNLAMEKLKAHKKAGSTVEAADPCQPIRNTHAADDDELHAIADNDAIMDEIPDDEAIQGAVDHVTDEAFLIKLLSREDEVAQARQPGQQGR